MSYKPFDLNGKAALVTGGNGGIGLAMAEALTQSGADVEIWGTSEEKNTRALERLRAHGRKVNARIIYASATGFGARGRYAGKPAYDDLIQGLSGIAAIARDAWGGEPRYMPLAIADRTVGLYLANAISAALYHRERTGRGQRIDTTLLGSALAVQNATFQVVESVDTEAREKFLHRLAEGPLEVGRLAEALGVSQPNVSQHLAVLRAAGLVEVLELAGAGEQAGTVGLAGDDEGVRGGCAHGIKAARGKGGMVARVGVGAK